MSEVMARVSSGNRKKIKSHVLPGRMSRYGASARPHLAASAGRLTVAWTTTAIKPSGQDHRVEDVVPLRGLGWAQRAVVEGLGKVGVARKHGRAVRRCLQGSFRVGVGRSRRVLLDDRLGVRYRGDVVDGLGELCGDLGVVNVV